MRTTTQIPTQHPAVPTAATQRPSSTVKTKAIIVFGAGHHARRIYIPSLLKNKRLQGAKIVPIDLLGAAPQINSYIQDIRGQRRITPHYLPENHVGSFEDTLGKMLLRKYDILGVIISTDPQNHMQYATWALKHNLHVLMDKPISTYEGILDNPATAAKLEQDYQTLMRLYKKSTSMFCLNTQRRYESGYAFVGKLIAEVSNRFGMPLTSLQVFYSDGLWIFPDEIMHQRVHPFNRGYGMLSHSGFHLLDTAWQLFTSGSVPGKLPDTLETFASATYAQGLVKNFGSENYAQAFGAPATKQSDEHYLEHMRNFGEMDVFANFLLKKDATPTAGITINLLHNSFSRRSWPKPGPDLYKGNGRVKHQSYIIEQGPFQCIQIHNYQAVHEHDTQDANDSYELGGKNHFDIQVFRNTEMFPPGEAAVTKYSAKEIDALYAAKASRLSNELAKDVIVDEFISNCRKIQKGTATRDTVPMRNSLTSYEVPVKMMAAVYKSLGHRRHGHGSPLISDTL